MKKIMCGTAAIMILLLFAACSRTESQDSAETTAAITAATTLPVETTTEEETTEAQTEQEEIVLTGITVQTLPKKLKYFQGDAPDTAGLVLKADYSDGTSEAVTEGFVAEPEKLNTLGKQTVTVSYGDQKTTFTVDVEKNEVKSIQIKTAPKKLTYYVGDPIDTTGMVLTLNYNNGTSETVTKGLKISPEKAEKEGKQQVTVSYGGKTASYTVEAKKSDVASIKIKTEPSKDVKQYVGDPVNTKGMTLTVNYINGKTETVSEGFDCTPNPLTKAVRQKVTVTYKGKTDYFYLTPENNPIKSLSVRTKPKKLNYNVGETLQTDGLTLLVVYTSGREEIVSNSKEYDCNPTRLYRSGTQEITVTYKEKTASFDVTVSGRELNYITVRSKKTNYYVGERFREFDLTLEAYYSDGATSVVTSGFTCDPADNTVFNSTGTKTIYVYYKGKSASCNVYVSQDTVSRIEVKTMPGKTKYYEGEAIDTTGLTLTVTYKSGRTKTVKEGFSLSPKKVEHNGQNSITVTYEGQRTSFNVTGIGIRSVEINKKEVKVNESIKDGLIVTTKYYDGKEETLSADKYTVSPSSFGYPGAGIVTIKVNNNTWSFTVTIDDVLERIYISQQPDKTIYQVGDYFEPGGMVVYAYYRSGNSHPVYNWSYSPHQFTSAGSQTVTITYQDKKTVVGVYVRPNQ